VFHSSEAERITKGFADKETRTIARSFFPENYGRNPCRLVVF
jgi:hypothetical protein